jgi:ABC-type lipoprotein export system ATPase subunit
MWTCARASSSRSWGRRARASQRCSRSSACSIARGRANTISGTAPSTKLNKKERGELHKRYIGFVFQSYHLLDHLTVYENLEIPLSYKDIKKSERQSIVADVLDRFRIVGKKDLYPNQLSGGQQQLVAVARAVISNPKLLLADEPTGNLHSSQGREIMELFKRLNDEGTTIIQVTHSEQNAAYGDRIVQLSDGWVLKEG